MQNGNKSLTLNIYNDWNEVDIIQKKNGAHTATITLTGTNPTDLFLTQTGNTTQTYSLYQNCVTVGGCSVSISQGN
jgi:spore coat protein U-like protein